MPSANNKKQALVRVPASAPVSPVASRCYMGNHKVSPVTPQRITRGPLFRNQNESPMALAHQASVPYTPLTSRSYCSSDGSILATPSSASSLRRLSLALSPGNNFEHCKEKGLADIAENWRARASENGIRVAVPNEDPHYADDEASPTISDAGPVDLFATKDVLLPPPLMSGYRRARAQSQALPPRNLTLSSQRQVPQTPSRRALTAAPFNLSTPPAQSLLVQQLKLKGCLTDPPQRRRRATFSTQATDLFGIVEGDACYEPSSYPSPSLLNRMGLPTTLNDPFYESTLSTIPETAQHHTPPRRIRVAKPDMPSCTVCGRSSGPLAILEPCKHPLCSACLTSALNIVGEKDMACAVCKTSVKDFHLQTPSSGSGQIVNPLIKQNSDALLPSAFDYSAVENSVHFFDYAQGSSTPVPDASHEPRNSNENVVLRIDNVPWDITPPAIRAWLKQPVEQVHVLLDRKGKTLSHAFVEVEDEDVAKVVLRSAQNSVLGKGKRARGVTVTRSNQEELMRALFPSWQGNFDGSRPSLAELDNEHVIATLEAGLITEPELGALLFLIRSPDSHFLKVPSLPFYSLLSILSKFPSDIDSRVFWSGSLRDMLFDVTSCAIQILLNRDDTDLLAQLVQAGMDCEAFTGNQRSQLNELTDGLALTSNSPSPSSTSSSCGMRTQTPATCHSPKRKGDDRFGTLAREFGIEADLLQALAERLAVMC